MPYMASFFPTNCRYSGVALGCTVGSALFGGTAPLIASFLTNFSGTKIAPAFWLVLVSLAVALQVFLIQRGKLKLQVSKTGMMQGMAA
jgi:hypothetical protein